MNKLTLVLQAEHERFPSGTSEEDRYRLVCLEEGIPHLSAKKLDTLARNAIHLYRTLNRQAMSIQNRGASEILITGEASYFGALSLRPVTPTEYDAFTAFLFDSMRERPSPAPQA